MRHLLKRPSPAMGVALIALFIALSGTTYAATGGNFILGQANTATTQTSLTAGVGGAKVLQLTNTSTASGAEGLGITVGTNKAPIRVNSTAGKAANLNSDKLDGLDSTAFLRTTGKAADSNLLDGIDSSGFLTPSAGTMNDITNLAGCNEGPIASYPLTLARSARIYGAGSAFTAVGFDAAGPWSPSYRVRLLDASNAEVAATGEVIMPTTTAEARGASVSGVLLSTSSETPYTAAPGNYTLEYFVRLFGLCAGTVQFQAVHLSNFLLTG
jgi:hypothetical protein